MDFLTAEHITKEYDGRVIIADISLHLDRGELVSLLGLSGSGKTTLFHVLSGLVAPEEGRVLLNKEDVTAHPGKVSYMLQKDLLLEHKKVIDNVSLPLLLSGVKKADARRQVAPLFKEFGLDGTQYQFPAQLSGGMRQRAALLRTYLNSVQGGGAGNKRIASSIDAAADALAHAGVALLDEPFSALDTITKSQMHAWYLEVMEKIHLTTLFITHDIDEAILLSDRIYILTGNPGRIRDEIVVTTPRKQRRDFTLSDEFLAYKREIIKILNRP